MPKYGTLLQPSSLSQGDDYLVFSAETVTAGELSERVALQQSQAAGGKGLRVVIDHSAAPGNCEYYVCEADNDAAGAGDYNQVPAGGDLTQASLVAGPNGAGTRLITDLIPIAGQNAALYTKTAPSNSGIKVTARFTRAV